MGAPKKLKKPVSVTTILEEFQHEALKLLAFKKRMPMAEILREAIENQIKKDASLLEESAGAGSHKKAKK